jgi:hypothetical protein
MNSAENKIYVLLVFDGFFLYDFTIYFISFNYILNIKILF